MPVEKEYTLQVGQAAKILQVTTETVRNMVERGELQAETRTHGTKPRYWFSQEDVEGLARKRGVLKS